MHIVNKLVINRCIASHPKSERKITDWYLTANEAKWKSYNEMRADVSVMKGEEMDEYRFHLGSKFIIVARVRFRSETIVIDFAGTEQEYEDFIRGL